MVVGWFFAHKLVSVLVFLNDGLLQMGFSESGNRDLSTRLLPPTSLCEDALQFVHFCWRSVSLVDVPVSKKQKQITSQIYLFSVNCEPDSFARLLLLLLDFILKMKCCERQRNIFEKAG